MTRLADGVRKRRWAPKDRSGCKTCRVRKKKCDLIRPICLRCSKGGYVCDGYEAPHDTLFSNDPQSYTQRRAELSRRTSTESDGWTSTAISSPDDKIIDWSKACQSLSLILEPSSSWCPPADQNSAHYFMDHVVPLLSTTRQWYSFWSSTVPQACWQDLSIHHAMVALAAAYESYRSGVNRSEDIISRHNLAIRAFTSKPTSLDLSLILCRLFSSTAKRMGDWDSAAVHIHHGGNILREAHHQGKAVSELASLMAPTFLCTTENILGGDLGLQTIFKTQQAPLTILKTIHAEYSQTLRLVRRHKNDISSPNRSFLLIAWSVMTQAMYSTMHPDLMLFTTEDPIVPARQVKANLADSGSLLDLRDLEVTCLSLFREIRSSLVKSKQDRQMLNPLQERLKICVDNFVVQGFEIEPRMTAGTFWHDDIDTVCPFSHNHHQSRFHRDRCFPEIEHATREKEKYYMEFVCPYRSGFMPTFYSDAGNDFIST